MIKMSKISDNTIGFHTKGFPEKILLKYKKHLSQCLPVICLQLSVTKIFLKNFILIMKVGMYTFVWSPIINHALKLQNQK